MELFSQAAEEAVVGSLLANADLYDAVSWLQPSQFAIDANRKVFTAVRKLTNDKQPVDVVTVAELLEKYGYLGEIGGIKRLVELAQASFGGANLGRYAEIVKEKSLVRKLAQSLSDATKDLHEGKDIAEVINSAQNSILSVTEASSSGEPTLISNLLMERAERIDKIQSGELKPISIGFAEFDEKFGGLHGGDLIILAGRPSMGKTALGVQIAEQMQTRAAPSLIFSCEMSNGQLVDRILSGKSRVSSKRLFRENSMTNEDWDRLTVSLGQLQDMHVFLDDRTSNLDEMRAKARTMKRKHGLGLIVIDYLQLMTSTGDNRRNREQEISAISRGLKAMAKELNVPVIALSQLSRKVEERQDKRPMMSDLRESGAIEQDADLILFVYRDDYYNPDSEYKGSAELINAKNRNGDTGKIFLTFEREHTRFTSHVGGIPDDYSSRRRPTSDDLD